MDSVTFNVGGAAYQTSAATLENGRSDLKLRLDEAAFDELGRPYIDRDARPFRHVLNSIRTGVTPALPPPELRTLFQESSYFGLRLPPAPIFPFSFCHAPKTSLDYYRNAYRLAYEGRTNEAMIAFSAASTLAENDNAARFVARANLEGLVGMPLPLPLYAAWLYSFGEGSGDFEPGISLAMAMESADPAAIMVLSDCMRDYELVDETRRARDANPSDPRCQANLAAAIRRSDAYRGPEANDEAMVALKRAWELAPGTAKFAEAYARALLERNMALPIDSAECEILGLIWARLHFTSSNTDCLGELHERFAYMPTQARDIIEPYLRKNFSELLPIKAPQRRQL